MPTTSGKQIPVYIASVLWWEWWETIWTIVKIQQQQHQRWNIVKLADEPCNMNACSNRVGPMKKSGFFPSIPKHHNAAASDQATDPLVIKHQQSSIAAMWPKKRIGMVVNLRDDWLFNLRGPWINKVTGDGQTSCPGMCKTMVNTEINWSSSALLLASYAIFFSVFDGNSMVVSLHHTLMAWAYWSYYQLLRMIDHHHPVMVSSGQIHACYMEMIWMELNFSLQLSCLRPKTLHSAEHRQCSCSQRY